MGERFGGPRLGVSAWGTPLGYSAWGTPISGPALGYPQFVHPLLETAFGDPLVAPTIWAPRWGTLCGTLLWDHNRWNHVVGHDWGSPGAPNLRIPLGGTRLWGNPCWITLVTSHLVDPPCGTAPGKPTLWDPTCRNPWVPLGDKPCWTPLRAPPGGPPVGNPPW